MQSTSDPVERDRTAERLKGSARRGVRRLRERFDEGQRRSREGAVRPEPSQPEGDPGAEDPTDEFAIV